MRIWPDDGEWGRVEDLGPVTPPHELDIPENYYTDHCGGLTFAADGMLYFVASRWKGGFPRRINELDKMDGPEGRRVEGVVWRMDPRTLKKEEVAYLRRPDASSHYVSRGAVDSHGDLFFGHVGRKPVGFFKVAMPAERRKKDSHLPLRTWG